MCSFTKAEAEEAERAPLLDPWPRNAPSYLEAVNQEDRVALLLLGLMREKLAELARAPLVADTAYARAQVAVAEGYRLDLLQRDVCGAVRRARAATLARIADDEENSPSTRWTARRELEELRP
jgi:hypothetical protein